MHVAKSYSHIEKRNVRPEMTHCPVCQRQLKRSVTISQRKIVTLSGVLYVDHRGYRCPDQQCAGHVHLYRSAQADALALPGFTFGLDVVVLVGLLKLSRHQTLDEVHQAVNERLHAWGVGCSRRNIMYLFEAYCTVLKAAHHQATDLHFQIWVEEVRAYGGMIISIDGIQPDKGNETIYLVREVVSGRVLNAENVTISDTATIKRVLEPVLKLDLPILGVISDAQSSFREAIAELWPGVPHQTCQFHYLQEAARPIFEVDRGMRAKLRKTLTEKLRPFRPQIAGRVGKLAAETSAEAQQEQQQLEILSEYALAVQASLHFDGKLPFAYPGVMGYQALDALAESLERVEKKGPSTPQV